MNKIPLDLSFPARININFAISGEVEKVVRAMNAVFLAHGFNEIDFSERSNHLPHVTLLMGEVSSRLSLERIIASCRSFSLVNSSLQYKIGRPYWKKPSQRYLFLDVEPLEVFRTFRLALHSEIEHDIACEFHGGPRNPSHVTVGYGDNQRIPLSDVDMLYSELYSQANSLRICEAGKRGTCRDVFASFKLPVSTSAISS